MTDAMETGALALGCLWLSGAAIVGVRLVRQRLIDRRSHLRHEQAKGATVDYLLTYAHPAQVTAVFA